ncbi:MAG: arginine--tRNA ligase [Leptospirales bacterium]|nr:arginine--tRNA ligase [Leptospirales bacterium]
MAKSKVKTKKKTSGKKTGAPPKARKARPAGKISAAASARKSAKGVRGKANTRGQKGSKKKLTGNSKNTTKVTLPRAIEPAQKKTAQSAQKPLAVSERPNPGQRKKSQSVGGGSTLKQTLLETIAAILPQEDLKTVRLPIEYARDEKFGDYALTAAMDKTFRELLAKDQPQLKNPRDAGAWLVNTLSGADNSSAVFERVEIAGPGFVNLTISPNVFFSFLTSAVQNPDLYGRTTPTEARKIIFEYVSANPTGPLNVVSARAAALGDCCCALLDWAGHQVFREYYVNDFGNQVVLLGQSCFLRALEEQSVPIKFSTKTNDTVTYPDGPGLPFPAEGYHGEMIRDVVREIVKRKTVLIGPRLVEHAASIAQSNDVPVDFISKHPAMQDIAKKLGEAAITVFLDMQKRDLERFRARFDSFYRESDLHKQNKVTAARNFLEGYVTRENGKQIFQSTKFGDDQDRVIVREDGRPTYLLADIAYHKTKMDRGFTEILNIWGPDHHGYIKRLAGALQAMGYPPEAFRVLIAQQVNLLEHGKPIVMSKRAGKFITMDTLMDEIPVDVLRYFFVMRSFDSHLDFDLAEAADTSEKNPYYYVAYAHARVRSITRKAAERGFVPAVETAEVRDLLKDIEWTADRRRLLFLVARFPEEVQDAARSLEPHRMINYLYNLANALSRFYAPKENRIIEQEPRIARGLLTLLQGVAVCLKNGLQILGMDAPEKMVREESTESAN